MTDNIKAYGEQLEAGAKAQADLEALLREERERHAIREKDLLGTRGDFIIKMVHWFIGFIMWLYTSYTHTLSYTPPFRTDTH